MELSTRRAHLVLVAMLALARSAAALAQSRGKTALKAFEAAGVVLQFHNPPARLLEDTLDGAAKGIVATGMTGVPDAAPAKRLAGKNALPTADFGLWAPPAVADHTMETKKAPAVSAATSGSSADRARSGGQWELATGH